MSSFDRLTYWFRSFWPPPHCNREFELKSLTSMGSIRITGDWWNKFSRRIP